MNVLQRTVLEVKIGDLPYHLEVAIGAPIPDIVQALDMMKQFALEKHKEYLDSEAAKQKQVEATQE